MYPGWVQTPLSPLRSNSLIGNMGNIVFTDLKMMERTFFAIQLIGNTGNIVFPDPKMIQLMGKRDISCFNVGTYVLILGSN